MLSYQHSYHAGNLADMHKHGALAWTLAYLTRKEKPLSYIETHAGRGIYDLTGPEATKTGEAAQGIGAHASWFPADHPLTLARNATAPLYPGSPAIALHLLRASDTVHLAELHRGEHAALSAWAGRRAKVYKQDGFALAHALCPPTPRRGLLLIDPPYELRSDYSDIPRHIAKLHRAWNVGTVLLWYPILANPAHKEMCSALLTLSEDSFCHEVRFPPARPGHGMVGSGLYVLRPPYGLRDELARLAGCFATL